MMIAPFTQEPIVEPNLQDHTITTEAATALLFISVPHKALTERTDLLHPGGVIVAPQQDLLPLEVRVAPAGVLEQQHEVLAEDHQEVAAEEFNKKTKVHYRTLQADKPVRFFYNRKSIENEKDIINTNHYYCRWVTESSGYK